MHSSTRHGVKRVSETQLSDLTLVTPKGSGALIDREDKEMMAKINPISTPILSKRKFSGALKTTALLAIGTVAFIALRWFLSAQSSITELFGSIAPSSQFLANTVTKSTVPYTVIGRFALKNCNKLDLTVISSFDGIREMNRVEADCTFAVTQMPESKLLAYTFNDLTNVINLEQKLFKGANDFSISLGELPIIYSYENFIKTNVHLEDLQTETIIPAFQVKVTTNLMNNEVLSTEGTDGQVLIHLKGGYYSALITADGYRPVELSASDLIGKKNLQIFLVKVTLGSNMIDMKATKFQTSGLKVSFYNKDIKKSCVVSSANLQCGSAQFFKREDKFNGVVREFVVYTETANTVVTPSVQKYKSATFSHRVLEEEGDVNPKADQEQKRSEKDAQKAQWEAERAAQKIEDDSKVVYTLANGTQIEAKKGDEVALGISGKFNPATKNERCKNDWTSKECLMEVSEQKEISVTTVMSTYLIFSPNITCIRPNIQKQQQIRVSKIKGDGQAFWYLMHYNQTKFIIITDSEHHPASIIHPDGVVVEILSHKARRVSQNRDMFASITTADGKYFNFDDNFWIKIMNVAETVFEGKLPSVNIESSNILDVTDNAFGGNLKRAVIEILSQDELNALFDHNDQKGFNVLGLTYTSEKGYKIVEVNSFNPTQKTDKYRVCIYCLKKEARIAKFEVILNDKVYDPKEIKFHTFLKNPQLLETFIHTTIHTAPRNTFVDESHARYASAFIRSENMKVKEFTNDNLKLILEIQEAGKLKNTWFRLVDSKRLGFTKFISYNVIQNDQIYVFNSLVASNFLSEEVDTFEPELQDKIDGSFDTRDHGHTGLVFPRDIINRIYAAGKNYKGLFVKATKNYADPAWPFKLSKEDSVINKWYLNLAEVRSALGMDPISGTETRAPSDPRTEPLLRRYENDIRESQNKDYLGNIHQVNFNRRYIDLNDTCMEFLYGLNLKGLFTAVEDAHIRLGENKFYYKHDDKIYIFKFDLLKHALFRQQFDLPTNTTIQSCLDMGTESNDPNEFRYIIINSTDIFEGYCHGTFINGTLCQGTFLGQYKSHCIQNQNCTVLGKEFHCDGTTNKDGCSGAYTQVISIDGALHELTTYQPYTIVNDKTEGEAKLKTNNDTYSDSIVCHGGYDDAKKICSNTEMEYSLKTENGRINGTISCAGDFKLLAMECESQTYKLEECNPQSLTAPGTCNGTYHFRDCENGGDEKDCHHRVERDRVIDCEKGYWDGNTCTIPPLYIIIDDHHFYSGTCQGEYVENNHCTGTLNGKLVTCNDPVTPQTLCTNEPDFTFVCNGTTTRDGCVGDFIIQTSFREHSFTADITTDTTPVKFTRGHNHSVTHITFNRPEGEAKIISITAVCNANFSDEAKTCGDAVYDESSYDGVYTRKLHIACRGTMNLNDLSCDTSSYNVSDCTTRFPFNEFPYCNGTFTGLRCVDGGSIENGCNGNMIANEKLACPMGVWNGKSCKLRPVHIILNNAAYITGVCEGKYIENEYCEGTMNARVLVCPLEVSSDNLCNGPTVDKFVCVGKVTKYGCQGKYTGSVNLKNAKLRLESPESATTSINKVINESVALTYEGVNPAYRVKTYGWNTVESNCGNGYTDPKKTCSNAQFKGVQQWTVNKTTVELACEGAFNMEELVCATRPYNVKHCNSTEPYENGKCNGTYTELKCPDGGDMYRCFGDMKPEVSIYCNGTYENGNCDGYIPPTLSIIRINSTHWIKGVCSRSIEDNACNGKFDGALFVACNGDPVSNMRDFDSCTNIPGATFGTCQGKLNEEGCRGEYAHTITIEGTTTLIKNNNDFHDELVYDFQQYKQQINLVINDADTKINVHCEAGFNPNAMLCPEANLLYVKENADNDIPALTLKTETTCKGAALNLASYSCLGDFKFSKCLGRAHVIEDERIKCLGDFYFAKCPAGGAYDRCSHPDKENHVSICLNSFWDGSICGKDKPSVTTPIVVRELPHRVAKDVMGRDVLIGEFEVESFNMIGGFSSTTRLEGNVIKSLSLQSAEKDGEGSLNNVKMVDEEYQLSFDEGSMNKMIFENFTLDELHYIQFATNDNYKLVHIKFKEFHINETMFVDFQSKNSVIKTLKYGSEVDHDFGFEKLPISLAYGYVNIRNAEVYLPYVSNSTIKKMMSGLANQKVSIVVPKIQDIVIPNYRIHIKPSTDLAESEIYIEFPQFTIENLSVNLFKMQDVIISSKGLTSKPVVVEQVLKQYSEDTRLVNVPDMAGPNGN